MLKRNAILLANNLHLSHALEIKGILTEGNDQNFIFPILKKGSFNNIFTFSHPSFKEYFLFLDIYQESKQNNIHPLLSNEIIKNPLVFEFLALCANYNKKFEKFLLQQIDNSKINKNVKYTASNAITILNRNNYCFIHLDYKNIQIPSANLSQGILSGVDLSNANLEGVNFAQSYMRNVCLNSANLKNAIFGEVPYIQIENKIKCIAISDDSQQIANSQQITIADEKRQIHIFQIEEDNKGPNLLSNNDEYDIIYMAFGKTEKNNFI